MKTKYNTWNKKKNFSAIDIRWHLYQTQYFYQYLVLKLLIFIIIFAFNG